MTTWISQRIPIDRVRPSVDNPNQHPDEKIKTLAKNIREFGLLNAITVKPLPSALNPEHYEIIAGEGRYRAYREIWKTAKGPKESEEWGSIPAVVVTDSTEWSDWGRRLSENKLRSFNWVAECQSLARMRGSGKSCKELSVVFGMHEKVLVNMVALGFVPGLERLLSNLKSPSRGGEPDNASMLGLQSAKILILPLRQWPRDTPKSRTDLDLSLYDYSECTALIDMIVSGTFTDPNTGRVMEDAVSEYVAERRGMMAEAAAQARVKELVAAEMAVEMAANRASVEAKTTEFARVRAEQEAEIQRREAAAAADVAKALAKVKQELAQSQSAHDKLAAALKAKKNPDAKLQAKLVAAEQNTASLQQQLAELTAQIDTVRVEERRATEDRLRDELTRQISDELQITIKAEKNAEAATDVADQIATVNAERDELKKEAARLRSQKEALEKRARELDEEKKRVLEVREHEKRQVDLPAWIRRFNESGGKFLEFLATASSFNYYALLGKPEIRQMMSVMSGVADELKKFERLLEERDMLGSS